MANLDYLSHQSLVDINGDPYEDAKIYYYLTGTVTPQNTYADAGLTSPNTNPVICDGNGVVPEVYLAAARYKRVVTDKNDVPLPQFDVDPLDATLEMIASPVAPTPTYPFMLYHNTTDGRTYRRSADNTEWIDEGGTDSLINSASVSEQLVGTEQNKVSTPDSVAGLWQRGPDIASAATLSLPPAGGGVFNVTGTTTIAGISSAQGGRTIKLKFTSALQLTHNATSFVLPGGANIPVAAGDVAEFVNDGAADVSSVNWRCFNFQRASGSALNATDQLASAAEVEAAALATKSAPLSLMHRHPGVAKAWVNIDGSGTAALRTSYNILSMTDNGTGDYTATFDVDFSSANYGIASHASLSATNGGCNWRVNSGGTLPTAGAFRGVIGIGDDEQPQDVEIASGAFFGDQ